MRLTQLSVLLVALVAAGNGSAATLNATKIGPIFTTTPIAETAFQALTTFRGQFTPVNLAVMAANLVLISTIGDGINALRVHMASPLPAAQSPVGWSDSETPPASMTAGKEYSMYGSEWVSTALAACLQTGYNFPDIYVGMYNRCYSDTVGGSFGTFLVRTSSCPAGYTDNGGACILGTPSAVMWPSDGVASVKPVNGVLTPNSRDPDNTGITAGPISRTGVDDFNNPVSETITSNAANGIDYQRDTQSLNSSTGESVVQRDKYSTDATGHVTTSTSTTYNNSTVANVQPVQSQSIDTSSLAKEQTLQAIDTKLATQNYTTASPTAARTIAASNAALWAAFTSHLPVVTMSDTVPDCPTFSAVIPFLNFTMVIDQYCSLDEYIRPVLGISAYAAYTLMGMLIVLGS